VALYGTAFVVGQGILPWATLRTYDSLVAAFTRFDWEKAVLFASDLGHYVGDAHNPLHITRNYDGQYTGNDDIHSHYETGMINAFNSEIEMTGDDIAYIADLNNYIFSNIYSNYIYVDSIILADDYAQAVAGDNTSYQYKAALWEKTGSFTIRLFNNASNSLAEMIFSAWVDAGKPDMNSGPGIFEFISKQNALGLKINPNPVKGNVRIQFENPENSEIVLRIIDIQGNTIDVLLNENLPEGPHELSFNLSELPEGIYFVSVESGFYRDVIKTIKITSN
jgi:hypothetical protein